MKCVLLSGGSGKRLWPLSNEFRSKQFMRLLQGPSGRESMLQRVWRQLRYANLGSSSYISTGQGQVDLIRSQLGADIPLIVEPAQRDTFPAIVLAVTYLYAMEGVSLDETIAIIPVDPYVDDLFFHKIKELDDILHESSASLALLGVRPTSTSEKFGYIVPKKGELAADRNYFQVSEFKEKPNEEHAAELIRQSALWNCGVLAFKLGFFIDLLIEKGLPIQYEELLKKYDMLPQTSVDYEIIEHADNIVAAQYTGSWKDIGTWQSLTSEITSSVLGKGTLNEDCTNTHIINELDIPIVGIGLGNLVIAASPDGILIADKVASSQIKQIQEQFIRQKQ